MRGRESECRRDGSVGRELEDVRGNHPTPHELHVHIPGLLEIWNSTGPATYMHYIFTAPI